MPPAPPPLFLSPTKLAISIAVATIGVTSAISLIFPAAIGRLLDSALQVAINVFVAQA